MPTTKRKATRPRDHQTEADSPGHATAFDLKERARGHHVMPVLRQFRELFRVSQQHFQRIESACGISGAQLWALTELSAKPGLRISELAGALSVHVSTASNLLDRLEVRGLIRRERGTTDQRAVMVFPTREGQASAAFFRRGG